MQHCFNLFDNKFNFDLSMLVIIKINYNRQYDTSVRRRINLLHGRPKYSMLLFMHLCERNLRNDVYRLHEVFNVANQYLSSLPQQIFFHKKDYIS